jgi:hypothetical protein
MASYFPHTLQRMTGNSQCQPALTAEYNQFRNSIQRYSAIGDNVFLAANTVESRHRQYQQSPARGPHISDIALTWQSRFGVQIPPWPGAVRLTN